MSSPIFDPRHDDLGHINVGGNIIERKAHDVVERIKNYDPNLEVLCVDPSRSEEMFEAPFVLGEVINTPNGLEFFKVFEFWELNDSVLERIYNSDTKRTDVLAAIDANNTKVRLETERRYREKVAEANDIAKTVADVLNKQSSATIKKEDGTKVTFYGDQPAKVEKA